MLAHMHPSRPWFVCETRPFFKGALSPGSMSGSVPGPPSAQGPFARVGDYPSRRNVSRRVGGRYPAFSARTDPCVKPNPSRRLRSLPWSASLCRLSPVPAGRGFFPTLSLRVFPRMPGPVPRRLPGCTYPFLPLRHRPSPRGLVGRRQQPSAQQLQSGPLFRRHCHSFVFRPPHLLATLAAPTLMALCPWGSDGVYVRAEHASLPSRASDILAVRTGQLTARGLAPRKTRSLVGRSSPEGATVRSTFLSPLRGFSYAGRTRFPGARAPG